MQNITKKFIALAFVAGLALFGAQVKAAGAPFIPAASASSITATSATLNGTVNPNGSPTSAWFNLQGGTSSNPQNIGGGNSNVPLSPYTVTGLQPSTTYYFNVEAYNALGNTVSSWVSFTTASGNTNNGNNNGNNNVNPIPAPTLNVSASPTNVQYGGSTVVSWNSSNANYCQSSWVGGTLPTNGSFTASNLTQTTTFSVTCTGAGGSTTKSVTVTVAPQQQPLPTVNLSANNTNLPYNGSTTLYWNSTNATSCNATAGTNGWAGPKATSGTFNTGNLTGTVTYNITCSGPGGSAVDSVTVHVGSQPVQNPTVNLTADNTNLPYNGSTTVRWTSANATSCSASGGANGWAGPKGLSGSFNTGNLTNTTTFSITCSNSSGSASDSVTVFVQPQQQQQVSLNLSANPTSVQYGGSSTITWNSSNATSCSASGGTSGWAGSKPTSGTFYANNLTGNTTFTLTCSNSTSSKTSSVTVGVTGKPSDNLPSVTTNSATNVGERNARLNGFVNSNGGNVTVWFQWGTNSSMNNTTASQYLGNTSGTNFNYNLTGLTADRTYYFRAVAQNSSGQTVYGAQRTFQTGGDEFEEGPEVTTNTATNIGNTSATLRGNVDTNGSSTRVWFEWGESRNSLFERTSRSNWSTSSRSFTANISGLRANTTYYFRAVAENDYGTDRGVVRSFTTSGSTFVPDFNTAPQAVTTLATNIGATSARLNGMGIVNGNVITTGYFEWGPTAALGNTTPSSVIGNVGSNPYFASLFSLSSNTTYFYRAVVVNQYGISRGDISTFRTNSAGIVAGTSTSNNTSTHTVIREVVTNDVVAGTARPSLVWLDVNRDDDFIRIGSAETYMVTYRNISQEHLRNIVLQVSLPKELQFLDTSRGYLSEVNNTVVVPVGDLRPGEEGVVHITVRVTENAELGKIVVIAATLAYTRMNDTQEEVFAYSKNTIDRYGYDVDLRGGAIWGAGFLPNTLLGWILLLLVILLVFLAAKHLYDRDRNRGRGNGHGYGGGYGGGHTSHTPPPSNLPGAHGAHNPVNEPPRYY